MLKFKYLCVVLLCSITACILFTFNYLNVYHSSLIDTSSATYLFPKKNQLVHYVSNKLLNMNYQYILSNESLCWNSNKQLLAVFIITSYYGNIETRNSIRQVFNSKFLSSLQLRKVFLLGFSETDKFITQTSIENENEQFGDLLQSTITEAYRNLTYKHLIGLKWVTTFCNNTKYIIKMDDDTVVNMYNLNNLLQSLNKFSDKNFIAGYVLTNQQPVRDKTNKWFVTKDEYPLDIYPAFVSGWFYVTNVQTVAKLLADINQRTFFWIDDVFVTGILREKTNVYVALYDLSDYFIVNSEFLQCCLQDFDRKLYCDITIGPNGGDVNMFSVFNDKVGNCLFKRRICRKRRKPLNSTCLAKKKINLGRGIGIVRNFNLI